MKPERDGQFLFERGVAGRQGECRPPFADGIGSAAPVAFSGGANGMSLDRLAELGNVPVRLARQFGERPHPPVAGLERRVREVAAASSNLPR